MTLLNDSGLPPSALAEVLIRRTMNPQLGEEPRSLMDDRQTHNLMRSLMERQIDLMNRWMKAFTPDPSSRLPAGEESSGGPGSEFQDQQPELSSATSPSPGEMNIDLHDQEEEFVLTAAVPGFSKDEIDVSLVDDVVQIEATHEEAEEQEDEGRYVRRERRRSMSRSVALGTPIAEDEEISAQYENGVLTIRLPKAEPAEDESGRQIDIE